MAYDKNTWVDQSVERPRTYEMTNNVDGSVTLIDSFGNVTELGTPVNADHMNHIEDGIEAVDAAVGNLSALTTQEKTSLVGAINELQGNSAGNEQKLEAQKAYVTGNVLTDEKGYQEVVKASRSTFDISKFEVVGSPVISEDGVASGLNNSNYVKTSVMSSDLRDKSWKICLKWVNLGNDVGSAVYSINPFFTIANNWPADGSLYINKRSNTGNFELIFSGKFRSTETSTAIRNIIVNLGSNVPNYIYAEVEYSLDKDKYTMYYDVGNGLTLGGTLDLSTYYSSQIVATESSLSLNIFNSLADNQSNNNAIDLKSYKITTNNQLIFSGAQTGLDVIKPDNYEVVGSPTISEDGVLYGEADNVTSPNNYATILNSVFYDIGTKSWKLRWRGKLQTYGQYSSCFGSGPNDTTQVFNIGFLNTTSNFFFSYTYDADGTKSNSNKIYINVSGKSNKDYIAEYSFDKNTMTHTGRLSFDNGVTWLSVSGTLEYYLAQQESTTSHQKIGHKLLDGYMDLNSLQLFIEDTLIYQPCLKIPYTLSKTGSKIVDASARSRVQDLYEQTGEALYYTLDEKNQNYTIPMGEVYGMIENSRLPERNLGEIVTSTIPLTDARLHLADGALLQQDGVYADFVAEMGNKDRFEVVGNPTITSDGVASGFTQANSIRTNCPEIKIANGFKIYLTASLKSMGSNTMGTLLDANKDHIFRLRFLENNRIGLSVGDESGTAWGIDVVINYNYSFNTKYYFKFEYNNNVYSLDISTDGINYTSIYTASKSFTPPAFSFLTIGTSFSMESNWILLDGSISLPSIKITSDNRTIFDGAKAFQNMNVFTTETDWQNSITSYGVCGKYVYDSTAKTLRLPKITGFIEGTLDATTLGDVTEAGLPDHYHLITNGEVGGNGSVTGSKYITGAANIGGDANANYRLSTSATAPTGGQTDNASIHNSTYGNSSTVQPQSIKVYYYIVVATDYKKNTSLVRVDNIVNEFNGKADVDLSNCTRPYIIEAYINGTSGYNLYSNGYCEQWGISSINGDSSTTVTLLKSFIDTNYLTLATLMSVTQGTDNGCGCGTSKTTDSFVIINTNSASTQVNWKAAGYIS